MSVYKTPSGKYRVVVDEIATAGGRRRRASLGTFTRKSEAERAERKALERRETGADAGTSRFTLDELFERFVRDAEGRNLSPKTINEYRQKWALYVKPRLGAVRVDRLRPIALADFYAEIRDHGGRDRITGAARPIGAPTVRHVADLIKSVLRWAYRLELVTRNVADFVAPPKGESKKRSPYQVDEAVRLIAEAAKTRHGPLVLFAFSTGLRRGELCALQWTDVDLGRRVATIRGSIGEIKGGTWYKSVKADQVKSIALSDEAITALRDQAATIERDRRDHGAEHVASEYVFARPEGGHQTPGSVGQAVRRIARRAKLSQTALHAMRHSTGSWLIAEGIDIRTVSAILRHSSPATTLNVYAHEITGQQAKAVATIGKRLRQLKESEAS